MSEARRIDGEIARKQELDIVRNKEKRTVEKQWIVYDSGFENMSVNFNTVLPKDYNSAGAYLRSELGKKQGNAIALEVGGPGSRLFRDINKLGKSKLLKKSIGITLLDKRSGFGRMEDFANNHEIVEGDLADKGAIEKIRESLEGEKADLIIERMEAGTQHLPKDLRMLGEVLKEYYSLVAENGIMFLEIPKYNVKRKQPKFEIPIKKIRSWITELQQRYGNTFIQISPKDDYAIIRIQKVQGAPEELPLFGE